MVSPHMCVQRERSFTICLQSLVVNMLSSILNQDSSDIFSEEGIRVSEESTGLFLGVFIKSLAY